MFLYIDVVSGGFIVFFLDLDLCWDFCLFWVKFINIFGYKYGLVYLGVGWIIWWDKEELLEELIFYCNYLGGDLFNFVFNFFCFGN